MAVLLLMKSLNLICAAVDKHYVKVTSPGETSSDERERRGGSFDDGVHIRRARGGGMSFELPWWSPYPKTRSSSLQSAIFPNSSNQPSLPVPARPVPTKESDATGASTMESRSDELGAAARASSFHGGAPI